MNMKTNELITEEQISMNTLMENERKERFDTNERGIWEDKE
jgi:hypothetical protein